MAPTHLNLMKEFIACILAASREPSETQVSTGRWSQPWNLWSLPGTRKVSQVDKGRVRSTAGSIVRQKLYSQSNTRDRFGPAAVLAGVPGSCGPAVH